MAPVPSLLLLVVVMAALSAAVLATGGSVDKLKHIHMYMHETMSGPNATVGLVVPSPLGANPLFGQVGVVDDELRAVSDKASPLVARYHAVVVGTGQASPGFLTSGTVVFVDGEFARSTLSVEGPVLNFTAPIERTVIGGTGKFRMARGYFVFKLVDLTPVVVVYEVDFFVLMYGGRTA